MNLNKYYADCFGKMTGIETQIQHWLEIGNYQ